MIFLVIISFVVSVIVFVVVFFFGYSDIFVVAAVDILVVDIIIKVFRKISPLV